MFLRRLVIVLNSSLNFCGGNRASLFRREVYLTWPGRPSLSEKANGKMHAARPRAGKSDESALKICEKRAVSVFVGV
jgi:hypothetical protein